MPVPPTGNIISSSQWWRSPKRGIKGNINSTHKFQRAFIQQTVYMRSLFFLLFISFAAFHGRAQSSHPVSWKFSSELIAPLTFTVNFTASINEPFHIYPQSFEG